MFDAVSLRHIFFPIYEIYNINNEINVGKILKSNISIYDIFRFFDKKQEPLYFYIFCFYFLC